MDPNKKIYTHKQHEKIIMARDDIRIPILKNRKKLARNDYTPKRMKATTNFENDLDALYKDRDKDEYLYELMDSITPAYEGAKHTETHDMEIQTNINTNNWNDMKTKNIIQDQQFNSGDDNDVRDIYTSEDDEDFVSVSSNNMDEFINLEDGKKMLEETKFLIKSDQLTGKIFLIVYGKKNEYKEIEIGDGKVQDVSVAVNPKWGDTPQVKVTDSNDNILHPLPLAIPVGYKENREPMYEKLQSVPAYKFIDFDIFDDLKTTSVTNATNINDEHSNFVEFSPELFVRERKLSSRSSSSLSSSSSSSTEQCFKTKKESYKYKVPRGKLISDKFISHQDLIAIKETNKNEIQSKDACQMFPSEPHLLRSSLTQTELSSTKYMFSERKSKENIAIVKKSLSNVMESNGQRTTDEGREIGFDIEPIKTLSRERLTFKELKKRKKGSKSPPSGIQSTEQKLDTEEPNAEAKKSTSTNHIDSMEPISSDVEEIMLQEIHDPIAEGKSRLGKTKKPGMKFRLNEEGVEEKPEVLSTVPSGIQPREQKLDTKEPNAEAKEGPSTNHVSSMKPKIYDVDKILVRKIRDSIDVEKDRRRKAQKSGVRFRIKEDVVEEPKSEDLISEPKEDLSTVEIVSKKYDAEETVPSSAKKKIPSGKRLAQVAEEEASLLKGKKSNFGEKFPSKDQVPEKEEHISEEKENLSAPKITAVKDESIEQKPIRNENGEDTLGEKFVQLEGRESIVSKGKKASTGERSRLHEPDVKKEEQLFKAKPSLTGKKSVPAEQEEVYVSKERKHIPNDVTHKDSIIQKGREVKSKSSKLKIGSEMEINKEERKNKRKEKYGGTDVSKSIEERESIESIDLDNLSLGRKSSVLETLQHIEKEMKPLKQQMADLQRKIWELDASYPLVNLDQESTSSSPVEEKYVDYHQIQNNIHKLPWCECSPEVCHPTSNVTCKKKFQDRRMKPMVPLSTHTPTSVELANTIMERSKSAILRLSSNAIWTEPEDLEKEEEENEKNKRKLRKTK